MCEHARKIVPDESIRQKVDLITGGFKWQRPENCPPKRRDDPLDREAAEEVVRGLEGVVPGLADD